MKKTQLDALHTRLLARWSRLLESEMDSDGFWEDVASALGREDVDELSKSDLQAAHEFIRTARQWMGRCPQPRLPS